MACRYEGWCALEGLVPWPVSYDSVSGYLCMFVMQLEGSSKSMGAVLHALRVRSEMGLQGGWLGVSDARRLALLVGQLQFNDMHIVERKQPIRLVQLNRWTRGIDLGDNKELMFVTMCYLGHDGLLRLGELLSGLTAAQVQWSHDNHSLSVILGRSKINRQGDPERIDIHDHRGRIAVKMMKMWFDRMSL